MCAACQLGLPRGVNAPGIVLIDAHEERRRHLGSNRAWDGAWPGGHQTCPVRPLVVNLMTFIQPETPQDTLVRIRFGGQFVS